MWYDVDISYRTQTSKRVWAEKKEDAEQVAIDELKSNWSPEHFASTDAKVIKVAPVAGLSESDCLIDMLEFLRAINRAKERGVSVTEFMVGLEKFIYSPNDGPDQYEIT